MFKFTKMIAVAVLVLLVAAGARAADWGTLTGRFVYDGKAPDADKDRRHEGSRSLRQAQAGR